MWERFFSLLYSLFVFFALKIQYLLSFFNSKHQKWYRHQRAWKNRFSALEFNASIWLHVASVGEFQMAKPLIQSIKRSQPEIKIVVSYFSISVEDFVEDFSTFADFIFLFPADTKANINFIIKKINPTCLILIENERWYNLVKTLSFNKIKIFIVEYRKKNQHNFFTKWYYYFIDQLIEKIFYADDGSLKIQAALSVHTTNEISGFSIYTKNKYVIILGSCYETEVQYIADYFRLHANDISIILAPHQYDSSIKEKYQKYFDVEIGLFSENNFDSNVLLIDVYGQLKNLYQYADIAFIGGGFSYQLHNVYEAISYQIPVIIGNKYSSDVFLDYLIEKKFLHTIKSKQELIDVLNLIRNQLLDKNDADLKLFFEKHQNISDAICKIILGKVIN